MEWGQDGNVISIMTSKWELSPPGGSISELQAKFPGGNVVFIAIKYNFQTNYGGLGNTICNHKTRGNIEAEKGRR